MEYWRQELYHHGVIGQRWGRRNGPPYPLDGSISTGHSLRKAIMYTGQESKTDKKAQRVAKAQAKAAAKYAKKNSETYSNKSAAAALAASIILDVATLNVVGLSRDAIDLGRAIYGDMKAKKYASERSRAKIDKKTGFALKEKELTDEEDLSRVNPSFTNFDANTKSNCMLCTTTYDLRKRGYDVTAKTAGAGFKTEEVKTWYPKAQIKHISGNDPTGKSNPFRSTPIKIKDATEKFVQEALSQGDGARGNIMVQWNNSFAGHSMIYEVKDGAVIIMDGQSNKVYSDPYKILKKTNGNFDFARLDNVDFDLDAVRRCCQ